MHALLPNRFALIVFPVVISFTLGCQPPSVVDETQGDPFEQMMVIQQCYFDYSMQNQKAPSSEADLATGFQTAGFETADLMNSPRDGKPIVILWGVMPDLQSTSPVVLGYESTSVGNSRMVMTTMGVVAMSDEEFQSAAFPEGHSAPNNLSTSK